VVGKLKVEKTLEKQHIMSMPRPGNWQEARSMPTVNSDPHPP